MNSKELKPCPFCGSEAKLDTFEKPEVSESSIVFDHYISCTRCARARARGMTVYRIEEHGKLEMIRDGVKEICDAWNERKGERNE